MRIVSLKCASCSAPLEINPETVEFVCAYCGSAQIVDRSGGAVTLKLVEESLGKIQQGTDRTAAELALKRLNSRLSMLYEDRERLKFNEHLSGYSRKLSSRYEDREGPDEFIYRVKKPDFPRPSKWWFSIKAALLGPNCDPRMELWKIYDNGLKSQAESKPILLAQTNQINRDIQEVRREIELNEAIVKRA